MKSTCISAVVLSLLLCGSALAAPGDTYEQQQSARRQEEQQQERIFAPSVRRQEGPSEEGTVRLPVETEAFKIDRFVIEEEKGRRFQWLLKELEPYRHRRIGAQGMSLLVYRLKERLNARGFITTQVTLPEQDLTDKVLTFKVIPGRIEAIRFLSEGTRGSWRSAFPCGPGDILNVYDLDQGLEQMKRVPNQEVQIQLEPGSEAGKTVVVLDIRRQKAWKAGLSWDNSGLSSTGRYQGTASLALYSPAGLNDILSLSGTHDTKGYPSHGSKNYSFSYTVPYGKYTFSLSHFYDEYDQTVPSTVPYTQKGTTRHWDFGLQRLVYRDSLRKTELLARLLHRHKRSYLNGEEIGVQELQTSAYQLGVLHRQYVGQGIVDAMVYYRKGIPSFAAMPGLDDHDPDYMTTRYRMWGYQFYYGTPLRFLGADARYSLTSRGQFTHDTLYSADQFSIGGRYTVRGFSGENTLSAENGIVLRNELGFPLKKQNLEVYLGIDYGRTWGPSDAYNLGNKLAGAFMGVRGRSGPLYYDGFLGAPIYKPEGFKAGKTALGFSLYLEL